MKKISVFMFMVFLSLTGCHDGPKQEPIKKSLKQKGEPKIFTREEWGAKPANLDEYEPHEKYGKSKIDRIIIGHTVTDLGEPAATLRAVQLEHMSGEKPFADISYHRCFDTDGNAYACRPFKIVPSLLKGSNPGSCALGLIGRFDEQGRDLSDDTVELWAKALGTLAFELEFPKLLRGQNGNVFGMSELAPDRFPISPGHKFLVKFDLIIEKANGYLDALRAGR